MKMTDQRAFEFHLMSLMRGDTVIAEALAAMGSTPEQFREAADRMSRMGFGLFGCGIDLYLGMLGPPLETSLEPGLDSVKGFAGSLRQRFHLPLWPDFDFVVRSALDGWTWGPTFVRRAGTEAPRADRPDALAPWSILESEVCERFGPFDGDDAWNLMKNGTYKVERAGRPVEITLVFDLDLLQRVIVIESPTSH